MTTNSIAISYNDDVRSVPKGAVVVRMESAPLLDPQPRELVIRSKLTE
jgi:hypothetical protein